MTLDNLGDLKIDKGFDGASYVKQVKSDYVEKYVEALKKL